MFIALGTNLTFSGVSAEIIGTEYIEVVRTNLGITPGSLVFEVNLDMEVPHFYLEVRGTASTSALALVAISSLNTFEART